MPSWLAGLKRPLKIGFVSALVVAAFTLLIQNTYQSTVTILPSAAPSASGGLGTLAVLASAFGSGGAGGMGGEAQAETILKSRWLRESLLQREFEFSESRWAFGKPKPMKVKLAEYFHAKNIDEAAGKVGGMVTALKDSTSGVLTINVVAASPELAQEVASSTTDLLEEFLSHKTRTHGGEKAAFAEKRLEEVMLKLQDMENQFKVFMAVNRNYQSSLDPEVRFRGLKLETEFRFQQQLVASLRLNYEQALTEEKNDVPILNIMDRANHPYQRFKPQRSLLVLVGFILATALAWSWDNRAMLFSSME